MKIIHFALVTALGLGAAAASAQTVFDQAAVLAGGITPGDAPGFPATLNLTGSYRLSGNLSPTPGAAAIEITERNVSLDLAGHAIDGGNRCTVASTSTLGADCPAARNAPPLVVVNRLPVRIHNGSIIGGARGGIVVSIVDNEKTGESYIGLHLADLDIAHNGDYGIDTMTTEGAQLRNVTVQRNKTVGAYLGGQDAIVVGANVAHNGNEGLRATSKLVGENIQSSYNRYSGIETANGTLRVADASLNGTAGVVGNLVAANVNASGNTGPGFAVPSLVFEAVANDNTAAALSTAGVGCYARIYVRTTSTVTPQVSGGPLHGTITSCP